MNATGIYDLHPFFEEVQLQQVFPDGKTLVDCLPRQSLELIGQEYLREKDRPGFDINNFIASHFEVPKPPEVQYVSDKQQSIRQHVEQLWDVLTRQPDGQAGSLIPLPYAYVVPGGRFGEIYYWDSYFTMLGLAASGKNTLLENMINNFSYLIDTIGYIPNGNRTYYIGRSQPPFYALMVSLLAEVNGEEILASYLPQMEREYQYWMKGKDLLIPEHNTERQVALLPGGEVLNRYWDEHDTPRPEAYREDVELSHHSSQPPGQLYRHLRAGAASGWDYSIRWFGAGSDFGSIRTTDIIPVDLNCLLFYLEELIARAHGFDGNVVKANQYRALANSRKEAIRKYCWNPALQFYTDYDIRERSMRPVLTLAGVYPLFFQIADEAQAAAVARAIREKFLCAGGLVTTLETTGQQWDAPNGWAPLQWMAIKGLENYGYDELAADIAGRWMKLNNDVFHRTGKLMEKYNVVDTHLDAGGGEYPGQDGFGWTNGVLLALIKKYGMGAGY